jgi:hypothetical protein
MKSLDEVQAWRPLNEVPSGPDAVHLITEPGVYSMSGPVVAGAGQHGVRIDLNGLPPGEYYVCVVSNGHPIRLGPGSLDGMRYVDGVGHDETIQICAGRDGDVRDPISGAGGSGVRLEGADRVVVTGLDITSCGGDGVNDLVQRNDVTFGGWGGSSWRLATSRGWRWTSGTSRRPRARRGTR